MFGMRFASNSEIIDAIDTFFIFAMCFNSAINSGSSEMLVWCPDKDIDNFFIDYNFPPSRQSYKARYGSSYLRKVAPVKLFTI